jgi:hypothetical protein
MGWTSSNRWQKKSDVVAEVVGLYDTKPLATKSTREGLWVLADAPKGPRIDYYMISSSGGAWGYKDLSECMGPVAVDVPLDWLDRAPEQDADWRKRVREAAERKAVVLSIGDKVVAGGQRFTLVAKVKRSWLARSPVDEKVYRIPATWDIELADDYDRKQAARYAALDAAPFSVITAYGSWHEHVPEGWVGVTLTKGGNREGYGPRKHALVKKEEYLQPYTETGRERPWCGPDGAEA